MSHHRSPLSIRSHLEHAALIKEGLAKYGLCPAIEDELKRFFFINQAILRADDAHRAKSKRT